MTATAMESAERVRAALARLNSADVRGLRLVEVLDLSHQLADAMQSFFGAIDASVYGEFRYIAGYISQTRAEISALRPNDIRTERLPAAGAELDAVVRHTEEATNRIMGAAEAIMTADRSDAAAHDALVQEKCLEIFEACSFQDITGQRVRKVVDTLRHIEERVQRFAEVMGVEDAPHQSDDAEEARRKALLLNGPALGGPETSQTDVDKLLASQDDIDKLFD